MGANDALLWRDHGQEWILPVVHREYGDRNPLTRGFTAVGLRWPALTAPILQAVGPLAHLSDRLRLPTAVHPLLSAAYGLAYRRALVEELGGLEAYREATSEPLTGTETT